MSPDDGLYLYQTKRHHSSDVQCVQPKQIPHSERNYEFTLKRQQK